MERKSTLYLRPELKHKLHEGGVYIHRVTVRWTHYFESACAGSYAIHEIFHFSAPVLWTAYGLLIFGVVSIVTVIVTKGG